MRTKIPKLRTSRVYSRTLPRTAVPAAACRSLLEGPGRSSRIGPLRTRNFTLNG